MPMLILERVVIDFSFIISQTLPDKARHCQALYNPQLYNKHVENRKTLHYTGNPKVLFTDYNCQNLSLLRRFLPVKLNKIEQATDILSILSIYSVVST
jgi:hypothetical protein